MTSRRNPGVEKTDGWRDLTEWLDSPPSESEPKRSIAALAERLSVTPTAVRSWVARLSRPSHGPLRDAVCRITGSDPERWETKAERADRERLDRVGAKGAA